MVRHNFAREKRRLKRWDLALYLCVFDERAQRLLGHIINISQDGFMLISDKPVAVGQQFDLWVEAPGEEGRRDFFPLTAISLWCQKDINPDYYDTGFSLLEPTGETLLRVQLLIDDFKIDEAIF